MRLEKLHLLNFKNYTSADVEFTGAIHCFVGRNGSGKTNLLEAIHYLCLTRGFTAASDSENVRKGEGHFLVRGTFALDGRTREVTCTYSAERKKKIAEDGKEYARFSDHIGKYPLVMVAPADIELVWDGGEVRRRFFDTLLSQLDRKYLDQLMVYQANLRHRNGLLKMYAERPDVDKELLATYDERLITAGAFLYQQRREFVANLVPRLRSHYDFLVEGAAEEPGIAYTSDLDTLDFGSELKARLSRDLLLGRTTVGVHRDDFRFTLQGNDLRVFGSQGQQKSFLIALKMAEFDTLTERNGFKPLLLLDDIFDKLDDRRIVQLMKRVADGSFGQIFLTDARPGRSREALAEAGIPAQIFTVEGGTLAGQP
ncbi:MAG: DNA replication and repair protein RecF [Cyclobacteriaceae bacterium]|nr:DNA replication and repair protein RecF [Cyclobacteriaceae bacterium]